MKDLVDKIKYHQFDGTLELELRRFIGSIDKSTFLEIITHIRANHIRGSDYVGELVHSRVAKFQLIPAVEKHLSQSCASCTGGEALKPKARCIVTGNEGSGMHISVKVNTAADMWLFVDDGDHLQQPFNGEILWINREYPAGPQMSALFAGCAADEWRASCRHQLATNGWSTKMEFVIHTNPKLVLSYWEGPDTDVGHATLELDFTDSSVRECDSVSIMSYERAYRLYRAIERQYLDFRSLFRASLYCAPTTCPIPSPSANKGWTKHSKVYVPHDQLLSTYLSPTTIDSVQHHHHHHHQQQQYAFAIKEDGIRTIVRFEAVYNPVPSAAAGRYQLQCIVDCPCPLVGGEWGISTYLTKSVITGRQLIGGDRSALDFFCTACWIVETRGPRWVIIDFQLPCLGGAYPGISFEHRVTLMQSLAQKWKSIGEDLRGSDGNPIEVYIQRWHSLPPSISASQLGFTDGILALHRATEMIFKIKPVSSVDLQVIHGSGRYTCNLVTMWGVKVAEYTPSLVLQAQPQSVIPHHTMLELEHQQVYEFAVYRSSGGLYLLPMRHRFDRIGGNSIFECVDIFQSVWGRPIVIDDSTPHQLVVGGDDGPNFVPTTPPHP
jgi:hypothetical protein